MPALSSLKNFSPPFVQPRHDPYLKFPRTVAALFLSVAQTTWFFSFLYAVQQKQPLTLGFSLLGLGGIFLFFSRVGLVGNLALAVADYRAKISYKPTVKEILHRVLVGIVLPFLIMTWGLLLRQHEMLLLAATFGLLCSEVIYRYGGYTYWSTPSIYRGSMTGLMEGSGKLALEALESAPALKPEDREATGLAIATIAVRQNDASILNDLEKNLGKWIEESKTPDEEDRAKRTWWIVRADHARMNNPEESGREEAEALAMVPSGHPRRLSLAMFVATAALDEGDGESAMKALKLLHSRDVIPPTPRALVNWLMLKAAETVENSDLVTQCDKALRTFNLSRLSQNINWKELNSLNNPYDRWILKAQSYFEGH